MRRRQSIYILVYCVEEEKEEKEGESDHRGEKDAADARDRVPFDRLVFAPPV